MWQIRLGLEDNLDVSIYAKSKFNWEQMREIRLGLFFDLNVLIYAKTKYSWEQMKEIRDVLEREARGN